MPELPEVEVVRAGLAPALAGGRITSVEIFEPRSLKRHDRSLGEFETLATGATPLAVGRRGKFLWMPLDEERAIVAHLGMSGQLLLRTPGYEESGLLRIRFTVEHPQYGELWWNFVDQRIFGSLAVDRLVDAQGGEDAIGDAGWFGPEPADGPWRSRIPSQVAHIARDPLDPLFDDEAWLANTRRSNVGIKRLLLDQNRISGIGNIYADESLWLARLHYDRPGASISAAKLRELLAAVRQVLTKALAEGGTSFDTQYVNVNGASGYFAHSLNAYGQQGRPCPRCGTMIRRASFMNRGSHFCPKCQRAG